MMAHNMIVLCGFFLLSLAVPCSLESFSRSEESAQRVMQIHGDIGTGHMQRLQNLQACMYCCVWMVFKVLVKTWCNFAFVHLKESNGWYLTVVSAGTEVRTGELSGCAEVQMLLQGWHHCRTVRMLPPVPPQSCNERSCQKVWETTTTHHKTAAYYHEIKVRYHEMPGKFDETTARCHELAAKHHEIGGILHETSVRCNEITSKCHAITFNWQAYARSVYICTIWSANTSNFEAVIHDYDSWSCFKIQTLNNDSVHTVATKSYLRQISMMLVHLKRSLFKVFHENILVHLFDFHLSTKSILAEVRWNNVLNLYANVSKEGILLFEKRSHLLSTNGTLYKVVFCSLSVSQENSSSCNFLTCLSLLQCLTPTRILKHNHSASDVNAIMCMCNVLFDHQMSPSQFSSHCYIYIMNILYFLVTIVYILKYLFKKGSKNHDTKQNNKGLTFANVGFSMGYDKEDCTTGSYSFSHSPSGPKNSILHNFIHHQWGHGGLRHKSDTNPKTSAMLQGHDIHQWLLPACQNSASFHRRRTKHYSDTSKDSETSGISIQARIPLWAQPVIHVYPVSRFLPDPTRNPRVDLAHVGYRLATLAGLPVPFPVSLVRLAEAGFYFHGTHGDEVRCYSCDGRYSGWTRADNPLEVHRLLSPNCAHLQLLQQRDADMSAAAANTVASARPVTVLAHPASCGNSGSGEVVVPNQSHVPSSSSCFVNGCCVDSNSAGNSVTADPGRAGNNPSAAEPNRTTSSSQSVFTVPNSTSTDRSGGAANQPSDNLPERFQSLPGERNPGTQSLSAEFGRTQGSHSLPVGGRRPSGTSLLQSNTTSTSSIRQSMSSVTPLLEDAQRPGSTDTSQNPQRSLFPRAGLDLGGAVYPMYQSMTSRRRTFDAVRWDETQAPRLNDVIISGMFYAGYADCVRCFYCGVGLKQWVASDDVWTEHIRWRPECGYLRAIRGEDLIRNTQRRLGMAVNAESSSRESLPGVRQNGQTAAADSNIQHQPPSASANTTTTTAAAAAVTATEVAMAASVSQVDASTEMRGSSGSAGVLETQNTTMATPTIITSSTTSATVPWGNSLTSAPVSSINSNINNLSNNSSSSNDSSNSERLRGADNGSSDRESASMDLSEDEQQRLARLQAENRTLASRLECRVCRQARIDTILLPCSHLVVCAGCAGSVTSCPLCSQNIRATARVHMA